MNLEKTNQWLSLVANIGLIAGFVLIALQLQQNTKALQMQAISLQMSAQVTAESTFMGEDVADAYAVAVLRPGELTEGQALAMWGYLSTTMMAVNTAWSNFQSGAISRQEWEAQKDFGAMLLDWPFGRVWWEEVKIYYSPALVSEIDQHMASHARKDFMVHQVRNIIRKAQALPPAG